MFSLQRNNKFCEMVRQFILTSQLYNILVLIFHPALHIYLQSEYVNIKIKVITILVYSLLFWYLTSIFMNDYFNHEHFCSNFEIH